MARPTAAKQAPHTHIAARSTAHGWVVEGGFAPRAILHHTTNQVDAEAVATFLRHNTNAADLLYEAQITMHGYGTTNYWLPSGCKVQAI